MENTTIYLVRHCEAMGNIDRLFHGNTDSDISEKGREQLSRLAERFREIPLDAIYSSPLKRTRLTAEAAGKYHGLPIVIEDGLIEINAGELEGMAWADFPVKYPEIAKSWNSEPWKFAPNGGETMAQVYERIWEAVNRIVNANQGKTVAVASHGCAIRNLLCRASGKPIEKLADIDWCDNTGVSILTFDESGNCTIVMQNDISHLEGGLSTLEGQMWWRKEEMEKLIFD